MVIKFNSVSRNYKLFSLHYLQPFTIGGREYISLYHYLTTMQYLRVKKGSIDVEQEIYNRKTYIEIKEFLENTTGNIKESILWRDKHFEYLTDAIRVKAFNDEEYKEQLISTGTNILVYVSPMDKHWSNIGGEQEENLLGKALMYVRDNLVNSKG